MMGGVDSFVVVGKVGRPHGLRGFVNVSMLTDWPDRFQTGQSLYLVKEGEKGRWVVIEQTRLKGSLVLLKLEDINNRESAESIRNFELLIQSDNRPPLPKGQYYLSDLIGLKVKTVEGKNIGRVVDVMQNLAQDIYVIENKGRKILIPAVKQFIKTIDLKQGELIVDPIEGLIDHDEN